MAVSRELIISDLDPYRLFPQYWLLIRNDPDALISAFPTTMIAIGLNVQESLLSITTIITPSPQTCGYGIVVNVLSIRGGVSGASLSMGNLSSFNFSINYHPQYKNTVFIFKLISKKKYSINLKLEII